MTISLIDVTGRMMKSLVFLRQIFHQLFSPLSVPPCLSPQRRAMDRAKKTKKVGVRYYDTHNVKNKNKNRKALASTTEGQKAKRSKHLA